jgi:hypothetical protein
VLCIFSFSEGHELRQASSMKGLEVVVIVAVIVAISCEVMLMIYTLYVSLKEILALIIEKVTGKK